jgi:hypothetical protein
MHVLIKASSTGVTRFSLKHIEHRESHILSHNSIARKQTREVNIVSGQLDRPEMHRSICTVDDMGLACVNFFVKPIRQCLY